jgi:predicted esterase
VRLSIAITMACLIVGCMPPYSSDEPRRQIDVVRGEIAARPGGTVQAGAPGLYELPSRTGRAAILYVPATYRPEQPMPLVVMLHGAGGTAQHSLELARAYADRIGFIVLAPRSVAATWDIIASRRYGPDVRALNAQLEQTFARYSVDPRRIRIAGFSDGASYALSLGLTNGDLFGSVIAFSPGFTAALRHEGKPRIFVSHGVNDRVLPIDVCSRRIVPQLRSNGYVVDYREFPGGHTIPADLAEAAFDLVSAGKQAQ